MITNNIKNKYYKSLIGKIYKILPIAEDDINESKKYLNSLLIELNGACDYIDDNYFTEIVFSLNGLLNIEDVKIIRNKVFRCISILEKIKSDGDSK